jgi:hypothetical protein
MVSLKLDLRETKMGKLIFHLKWLFSQKIAFADYSEQDLAKHAAASCAGFRF